MQLRTMICAGAVLLTQLLQAQDTVRYTGSALSNADYHHGQLSPVMGVHNIQTMRALRSSKGNESWTYNHAPMLAYWKGKFYLEYLSNPVGEHIPPGQTFLQTSNDGYQWTAPIVLFPPYRVPDGYVKPGKTDTARNTYAVMHQRIGFHISAADRLFALGYYGVVIGKKDDPNDGHGIGRVIREIKKDGSLGEIYFLRFNHAFNEKNAAYPFYTSSKDTGFVAACKAFLATPLLMMQTVEEADRNDPLIPLQKDFKAFNYYHLPNGNVVGLWKYALTSISKDEGRSWQYNPMRAPGFVNANAKVWGQRTSDGRYAIVYNPSEFRWPLAVSTSTDGLRYSDLLLINGEITAMRYGGAYKSYGPQYVRGIQEGEGKPADGNMWVSYSMNKEDMWVSRVPVPIRSSANEEANDRFHGSEGQRAFNAWNIYSPLWCKVRMKDSALLLQDADPFDYAKAERIFPAAVNKQVAFSITSGQDTYGLLEIELADQKGNATLRLILDSAGNILTKQGYRNKSLGRYRAGERLNIVIELNAHSRFYTVSVNGKTSTNLCFQPVKEVHRIIFRTGSTRRFPDVDTPTDQDYDLKGTERREREAFYKVYHLQTK